MRNFFRTFAWVLASAIMLSACKSSTDKAASGGQAVPASAQSSVAQMKNALKPVESGEYSLLAVPQATESGGKIEVIEFFGYFCNHCHALDPALSAWVRKQGNRIAFRRIPVRADEGKLFYALEAMGKLDALHDKIFHAVQVERKRLNSEEAAADFVAQHGVDRKQFLAQYQSFAVQSKAQAAGALASAYAIEGVPMIAIDGRYVTSASHAAKRAGAEPTEAALHRASLLIAEELVVKAQKQKSAAR